MNAPASHVQFREAMRGNVHERAHRAAISLHCPNCDEMEMAARCDLAALRDAAAAGIGRAGDSAAVLLHEVARLATQAVYAPAPASQLIRLRSALSFTVEAARALERVTQDG